jgi:TPR repeat protein
MAHHGAVDDAPHRCFDTRMRKLRQSETAMPARLLLLCVLQLALSFGAFAQEAPVTDCDKYAASDLDPQRKAMAVPFSKIDPALAVSACEDAVRQFPNNGRLLFQLGRAYQAANDFAAALAQMRKAAEQNYALAQFDLGYMYENGRGVPNDDQQAVVWLRKAADQGLATAQYNLGLMYQNGRGVPNDDQEAMAWFRKAADQNDAKAQFNLGVMYANGRGVAKDDQQAFVWFRKAANQRLVAAQLSLGGMYARGEGVPRDYQQAIFWYRNAADQGDREAKIKLNEIQALQNAAGKR